MATISVNKSRLDIRFFYTRLASTWNVLPENIVKAPTLNSFKKQLEDRYKRNGFYGRRGKTY